MKTIFEKSIPIENEICDLKLVGKIPENCKRIGNNAG